MKLTVINGKPEPEKRSETKKKAGDDDEKVLDFAIDKFRMMKKNNGNKEYEEKKSSNAHEFGGFTYCHWLAG
jgi:hypothetical protein